MQSSGAASSLPGMERNLERLMDATDDEADKKMWKTIVEDLETRARN
jgi:hypothetical protein